MHTAERLGKYQIVRHLAKGGMANVYLARVSGEGGFERHVVLKTIADEQVDATLIPMFLDEARIVATLHHQHIAQVYEIGHTDGAYYLAMEYVHGETVRAVLETTVKLGQRLPLEFGLTVACAAASGLHHAHERRDASGTSLGIIHRDVTPSNVLVSYDGSIKVIDFGIAKAVRRKTRTATGFIKGKAGYMAPEQVKGYPVDRRSDVFALGILAYETTTQKRAFHAESQYEQLEQIAKGRIVPPSALVPRYPVELECIVMRALELDPDERYPDAASFRTDLERVARGLGLRMGPDIITDVLIDLYGPRPEPWLMEPGSIDYDLTPPVADMPMSIEVIEQSERSFARGSDELPAMRSVPNPTAPPMPEPPAEPARARTAPPAAHAERASSPSVVIPRTTTPSEVGRRAPSASGRAPSHPGRAPSHPGRAPSHPGAVPIISIPEPVTRAPSPSPDAPVLARSLSPGIARPPSEPDAPVLARSLSPGIARPPSPDAPVLARSLSPGIARPPSPEPDAPVLARSLSPGIARPPSEPDAPVLARSLSPGIARPPSSTAAESAPPVAPPAPSDDTAAPPLAITRAPASHDVLAARPRSPTSSPPVVPRVKSPTSPLPSIVRSRTPTSDSIAAAAAAAAASAAAQSSPSSKKPTPVPMAAQAAAASAQPSNKPTPVPIAASAQMPSSARQTPTTGLPAHALPSVVSPLPADPGARPPRAAGTIPPLPRAGTMRGDATVPEGAAAVAAASTEVVVHAKGTGSMPPLTVDPRDLAGFAANPNTQPLELVDLEPVSDVERAPVRRRAAPSTMSTRPTSRRAIYAASGVAAACALAIVIALLTRGGGGGEATSTAVAPPAVEKVTPPKPKREAVAPEVKDEPPPPAPVARAAWAPIDGLAEMAWKVGATRPPEPAKPPVPPAPPKVAANKPATPRPPVAKPAQGKSVAAAATVARPARKDTAAPKTAATMPGHVVLHVITDPPDSTVVLDGVRMGRTPFHAEVPARKEAWLKVRRFDRTPVATRVVLDRDVSWQVKLPAKTPEPPRQASK